MVHLGVKLVVVLGHEGCGAVAAARASDADREKHPVHLRDMCVVRAEVISSKKHPVYQRGFASQDREG